LKAGCNFLGLEGDVVPSVSTLEQLMVTCLQDLRKGEGLTLDRFPAIADAVTDTVTGGVLRQRLNDARLRANGLDALGKRLGVKPCGDENLLMMGMLDDAEGDMKTEEAGPLLDLALIGAVRKMVNASLVSYETAVAVAARLNDERARDLFADARDREAEAETGLRASLFRIAAGG
jgi:ferritin-like metal-binding protein YciE